MLARACWLHRPPPSFCGSAWPLSIEATHRHHSPHSTWRGNTTLHSSCRSNTCVGILDYDHVRKHESSINKRIIFDKLLRSRQTYSLFSKNPSFSLTSFCILVRPTACSQKYHSFSLTSICILVRLQLVLERTIHSL